MSEILNINKLWPFTTWELLKTSYQFSWIDAEYLKWKNITSLGEGVSNFGKCLQKLWANVNTVDPFYKKTLENQLHNCVNSIIDISDSSYIQNWILKKDLNHIIFIKNQTENKLHYPDKRKKIKLEVIKEALEELREKLKDRDITKFIWRKERKELKKISILSKYIRDLEKSNIDKKTLPKKIPSTAQNLNWIEDNSQDIIYSNFLLMNFLWSDQKEDVKKIILESINKLREWWEIIIMDYLVENKTIELFDILDEMWLKNREIALMEWYCAIKIKKD